MAFKKRNEFYHSAETIRTETGIKRSSLRTIINKFETLGIISTVVKGMPRVTHFQVHYPRIVELFPKIYQLSENGQLPYELSKQLADFFLPLVDNYQEKNNNKNTKEEFSIEKYDSESEVEDALLFFNDFLAQFRYQNKIAPAALKYKELDFIKALKVYDRETIIEFVKIYFTDKVNPKLSKFFEFDQISKNRLVFIEKTKAEEYSYAKSFIDKLQKRYIQRLNMHNRNDSYSRGKNESKLVVTERIVQKMINALRVKSEVEIENAFVPYIDEILKGESSARKILPYFLSIKEGEYEIIDTYLE
ncbi:hypothetical protein [Nonlabens spongiae]|nr:hypothetical protein [Nonlabens spongiae]